jgi:hypothetical protein
MADAIAPGPAVSAPVVHRARTLRSSICCRPTPQRKTANPKSGLNTGALASNSPNEEVADS